MRCQAALGEWEQLCELAREEWGSTRLEADPEARAEVARLAASAACNLRLWEEVGRYAGAMRDVSVETFFYRALLATHAARFDEAQGHIARARVLLDPELTALVGESYHRAYRIMIQVQQLAELEEIILHKSSPLSMPLDLLVRMWRGRLAQAQLDAAAVTAYYLPLTAYCLLPTAYCLLLTAHCLLLTTYQAQLDTDVWQDVLSVRYLVAPPARDVRTWLKFGALCRKSGRGALAHKILVDVLGTDPALVPRHELPAMQPAVCFAFAKQLWERGGDARREALERLRGFVLEPLAVQDHDLAAKARLLNDCDCARTYHAYFTPYVALYY